MTYYTFMINSDRYDGSCNTPDDFNLPHIILYVPNKTKFDWESI